MVGVRRLEGGLPRDLEGVDEPSLVIAQLSQASAVPRAVLHVKIVPVLMRYGRPLHDSMSPGREHGRKRSISVTIAPELMEWVEDRTGPGEQFSSVSHAFERGIACLQDREDEG